MRPSTAGWRVAYALLIGAVTGLVIFLATTTLSASILLGWDVSALVYLAWTWWAVRGMDPLDTAAQAKREDPSNAVAELVVLGAGTAMLAAVSFALVKAGQAEGGAPRAAFLPVRLGAARARHQRGGSAAEMIASRERAGI